MFSKIPAEMQAYPNWVCWRYEDRGEGKPTKVPYDAKTNKLASVTKSETWSDFQTVCLYADHFDGIGFVLSKQDPYCVIDLDPTKDEKVIAKQVQIQQKLDSYSEVSPSGKGLHIIVKASLKKGRRRGPFEFYSSGRFITMTGKVYENKPIQFTQNKIENIMEGLGLDLGILTKGIKIDEPEKETDLEIYNKAKNAANGAKFLDLWNGDIESYHFGDHSRADFAMIDILAFYTRSRTQIKRLFRTSALGQRTKAKRENYLDTMIDRSFDTVVPEIDFSQLQLPAVKPVQRPHQEKPARTYSPVGPMSIPPGLAGDIASFIYQQSYKPVPEMAITGAIGLMAGINGRAFNISGTGLNLYMLLLARTGRGKEEIAKGISKITSALQVMCPSIHDFEGPGDLASGQALLRYMTDHKTGSFLSIFGEFGIKLKSICKPNALGSDLMLQKVLLDLYSKSGATDKLMPTAYSDAERNTSIIHSPAVSMIGESTPDWFYDNVDESMINSGLLPRFCVVEFLGKRPRSNHEGKDVKPDPHMLERIATMVSVSQGLLQARQRTQVKLDSESQRLSVMLDERGDDEINSSDSGLSAELWNRAHLKALRVAGLLAVGKNPYQPVVDRECWMWAEKFVVDGVQSMKKRFDGGLVGDNTENQQANTVAELLAHYLNEMPQDNLITPELHHNFTIPWSYISKKLRSKPIFKNDRQGTANAIRRTLMVMEDAGMVKKMPPLQSEAKFGTAGKCYVITGDLDYMD